MYNLEFKQLVKKKSILLTFIVVCSLFISEKVSAVYDKTCCSVYDFNDHEGDYIQISFKFFEYEPKQGLKNSYLKKFEVTYLTSSHSNFRHLMSASTDYQTSKTWAWIHLTDKKANEKIEIIFTPRIQQQNNTRMIWKENCSLKLDVANIVYRSEPLNTLRCVILWHPPKDILSKVTQILIKAKWYNHENMRTEEVFLLYDITPKRPR